ncbi:MAG: hypothetical protein LBE09_07835 [Christensenellaceae bacterium]|nr:hypothetical protein [Christensenellaceae bacterium]
MKTTEKAVQPKQFEVFAVAVNLTEVKKPIFAILLRELSATHQWTLRKMLLCAKEAMKIFAFR